MNGGEFFKYFEKLPSIQHHFKGVFSIDLLPSQLNEKQFCICNIDVSTGKGKHWFAIIRYNKQTYEVFDSLGFTNEKISIFKVYAKFSKNIIYNKTRFQKNNTDTCGLFCLYFLIERLHNFDLDYDDLLENIFLSEDLDYNEKIVVQFSEDVLNDFKNGE